MIRLRARHLGAASRATPPSTCLLAAFLAWSFDRVGWLALGRDRSPELRDDHFRNYEHCVRLAQNPSSGLRARAQRAAAWLDLPFEVRETGEPAPAFRARDGSPRRSRSRPERPVDPSGYRAMGIEVVVEGITEYAGPTGATSPRKAALSCDRTARHRVAALRPPGCDGKHDDMPAHTTAIEVLVDGPELF